MKAHIEHVSSRCFPERIAKPKIRLACAASLAVLWIACGETTGKVLQRYEPQFNEKRQQFKKVAAALPAPGSVKEASPAKLSPKPVYDEKNSDSSNTEIVMYDQLLDPDIKSEGNKRLDLLLSANLLTGMRWTGPNSPISRNAKSNPNMEQSLKQGLSERYLVVLRPVNYVPPVATDENTFKPGMADIEGFVVDLPDQKVAGSFRYTAHSSDRVEYSSRKGDNGETRQSQLEKFAYSSLYEDARKKLKPLLEQTTGGNFAISQ